MPSSECEHVTYVWVSPQDLREWLAKAEHLLKTAEVGDSLGLASFQIGRDHKHTVNIVLDQNVVHSYLAANPVSTKH